MHIKPLSVSFGQPHIWHVTHDVTSTFHSKNDSQQGTTTEHITEAYAKAVINAPKALLVECRTAQVRGRICL
jgi:hypothetical protein